MTRSSPKRIGLLGGTFDPIHIGHLRAALEARKTLDLDEVCLIPAARPPHKANRRTAISQNRLNMLQSAVKGVDGLTVSDLELHRAGPSYTLDTVTAFLTGADSGATFFLMMGLDAFLEFDTWYRYQNTVKENTHCRDGPTRKMGFLPTEMRQTLRRYLKKTLPPEYDGMMKRAVSARCCISRSIWLIFRCWRSRPRRSGAELSKTNPLPIWCRRRWQIILLIKDCTDDRTI